ncbi:hypothetical protein TIFTF001_043684 [Ficus carica]|uniref:Uncharacterized protein n=1 Tax=Ficus carica TaxID=3494 RepID=A0AA87YUK4_FICCA|nr:hypothetical protein TIFTF001_043684 [Ficus carica]
MDPDRVDEDRDIAASFYESHPLLFDGTHRIASLSAWLYDMETIFHICHIEAHLQIRQHIPAPTPDMTVGHMIDHILDAEVIVQAMQADAYVADHPVPVDDAGIAEQMFEAGPAFPEVPIPAAPLQEVPAPEVDIVADDPDTDDDMDAPEDPPIIDISSDDEDDGEEPEYEPEYGGWIDKGDEFEDDPEEILFDDGDWDADSDDSSVVTIEYID